MSRDDRDLLDDVLERIHLTAEFTQGDRDTFMQSRLIQEAVIRNLEVIGEAARGVLTPPPLPRGFLRSLSRGTGEGFYRATSPLFSPSPTLWERGPGGEGAAGGVRAVRPRRDTFHCQETAFCARLRESRAR